MQVNLPDFIARLTRMHPVEKKITLGEIISKSKMAYITIEFESLEIVED